MAKPPKMHKFYFLGPTLLFSDGEAVQLPYQKAEAVLAYLAVTRRRHSRERLATLLWGDSDDKHARSSLRNALYTLRKRLIPDALLCERQFVAINDELVWTDVGYLQTITKSPLPEIDKLQQALDLWRGPFLDGLVIPSMPTFEEWLYRERRQLEDSYRDGWLNLSKLLIIKGKKKYALEAAKHLIHLDRLSEPAYRHLIRLHLMNGDRAAALQKFEELRVNLVDELDVEPDPVSQALYRKALNIRTMTVGSAPISNTSTVSFPTSGSFVGRQQELQLLSQKWNSVSPVGPARMVLIAGEPGIGKTRIISEWTNHIDEAICLTARCFETETDISYNIWSQILRSAQGTAPFEQAGLADGWLSEFIYLLPELHSRHPDLPRALYDDSKLARGRLIQAVYQWMNALSQTQSICLFIDNLQWIDQASLSLLEYILRNGSEIPLLVLGAQRAEEAGSAWEKVRVTLKNAGILHQIHLHRLSFDEVSILVSAFGLSMADPVTSIQRIFQETEGNPLFVVELVRTLQRMDLSSADEWPVPSTVQGVIRARLSRLSPEARVVMSMASVMERNFTSRFLELASQNDAEVILRVFDEALDANVIVEQVGGTYEFSHDKIRSVMYKDLVQNHRQHLHQQVAQTLENQREKNHEVDFGLISHHYESAGNIPAALEYALRAAKRAVELYVDVDALTWYDRVLNMCGQKDYELPENLVTEISPFGQFLISATLPLDVLGLVYRQRGLISQRTGHYHQAEKDYYSALRRAERRTRIDEQGAAHNLLSFLAYLRSEYELVSDHAQKTLEFGTQVNVEQLRAAGLRNLGIAAYHTRDFDRALVLYTDSLDVYSEAEDNVGIATCYNNIGFALRTLRRYDEAIGAFQEAFSYYESAGQIEGQAVILANIGRAYAAQGDADTALDYLERAHQLSEESRTDWIAAKIWRTMGRVFSQNQRWDEALEAANKAQAMAESLGSDEDLGATYRLLGEIAAAWPGSNLGAPGDYFEQSIFLLEKVGELHEVERTLASFDAYKKKS